MLQRPGFQLSNFLALFFSLALIACFAGASWAQFPQNDPGPNANNSLSSNFVRRGQSSTAQAKRARKGKAVSPYTCLQKDIKLKDVVTYDPGAKKVTVKDKLTKLKARCRHGKLIDRRGRPIYFYALKGCWGNPPARYQEILNGQKEEIRKLKKRYTVIEMTCNPDGLPIQ